MRRLCFRLRRRSAPTQAHTFCLSCIDRIYVFSVQRFHLPLSPAPQPPGANFDKLICPSCRAVTWIPRDQGLRSLNTNFLLASVISAALHRKCLQLLSLGTYALVMYDCVTGRYSRAAIAPELAFDVLIASGHAQLAASCAAIGDRTTACMLLCVCARNLTSFFGAGY